MVTGEELQCLTSQFAHTKHLFYSMFSATSAKINANLKLSISSLVVGWMWGVHKVMTIKNLLHQNCDVQMGFLIANAHHCIHLFKPEVTPE